ncbi:MAG TPA: hypothetical protein V6D47_08765 [Oscillatoriaceae cyanobacterium]
MLGILERRVIRVYYFPPDLDEPDAAPSATLALAERAQFSRGRPSRLRFESVGQVGLVQRNARDADALAEAWRGLAEAVPTLRSAIAAWWGATTLGPDGRPDLRAIVRARAAITAWQSPRRPREAQRIEARLGALWRRNQSEAREAPPRTAGFGSAARLAHEAARLWEAGEAPRAIMRMRAAVRQAPREASRWRQLAWLLAEEAYFDAAATALDQALGLAPQSVSLHEARGLLALQRGAAAEALDDFTTAARLAPAHSDVHALIGAALVEAGRYAESQGALRQALALDARSVVARYYLVQSALAQSDVISARHHLGVLHELAPELDLSRFVQLDPSAIAAQGAAPSWKLPSR